jgi:MFS family permease
MMKNFVQKLTGLDSKAIALRFVLMFGVISLFADFTYEGSRSIVGPYLAQLGASGTAVGIIAGLGELLGYGLRLVSGRVAEKTGAFWPITLFGYAIQMISVPLLALAGSWQVAALLIVVERIGRATRNPPRDVMLSHAGKVIGFGWAFGLNEALDQTGAIIGPLSVAAVLAAHGQYKTAFAMLLIPALITLTLLVTARLAYPRPEDMETDMRNLDTGNLPRIFWIYLAGAALVATGFPDFSMMSYHFGKMDIVSATWIPVFYALAMGSSGLGSLIFGRIFDRKGLVILIPLTVVTTLFAPKIARIGNERQRDLARWDGGSLPSCGGRRAASTPPTSQCFSLRSHPTASTIEYLFAHAMHYASMVPCDKRRHGSGRDG